MHNEVRNYHPVSVLYVRSMYVLSLLCTLVQGIHMIYYVLHSVLRMCLSVLLLRTGTWCNTPGRSMHCVVLIE